MPAPSSTAATPRSPVGARSASATTASSHDLPARNVVVAVGSVSKMPPIDGIDAVPTWTNREATLARELPRSLLVLGGGPTGCELAQVYVRFGVPTTIVQSGPRLAPTDHPRNSDAIREALERDGVTVRTGVRALRRAGGRRARRRARHRSRRRLDGGRARRSSSRSGGRSRSTDLGLEHYGIDTTRPDAVPARRPPAHRRRPVGDRRPGRARSCTPTRPTTRASSRSGWRSARPSSPTIAPCRGPRTRTRRRRRSG